MFLLSVSKCGWTLLVLELFWVLFSPVNGRPALEDLDPAQEEQEIHGDEIQDENWEDDDDESDKVEHADVEFYKDVCPGKTETLEQRCLATYKCCVSIYCEGIPNIAEKCSALKTKDKDFEDQEIQGGLI